jgi:hypothetical protein
MAGLLSAIFRLIEAHRNKVRAQHRRCRHPLCGIAAGGAGGLALPFAGALCMPDRVLGARG